MKRLYLIAFTAFLIPMLGLAQVNLHGLIVGEPEGNVLSGAHILLNGSFRVSISDSQGKFVLKDLKPGTYRIKVSHLGYAPYEQQIVLDQSKELSIKLLIRPLMEEEVIVQATRAGSSSPTTYSYITKKEISSLNLGQDLPYLLDLSPSVVATSDAGGGVGYTGIRIRGTDISRINVTINGIPLNDPESQGVFWVNMPDFSSSVESIQVQRGIGSSTNGAAAFGASINIQTQNIHPEPYTELNLSGGSFNTFKRNLRFGTGLINKKFSLEGRLSRITSNGYIDRSGSSLSSYYISAAYQTKTSITRLNIISGKEITHQAWDGIPSNILDTNRTWNGIGMYTSQDGSTQYYDNEIDNYRQDHYQLMHTTTLFKKMIFNTSLFYIHGEGYYEQYKPGQKVQKYNIPVIAIGDTLIKQTDLIRQKSLDNDFYGMTWSLQYNQAQTECVLGGAWHRYEGLHFGEVIWGQYLGNLNPKHRWYENQGLKEEMNVYLKAIHQIYNKLSLYGDVQFRKVNYSIQGIHDDLHELTQSHEHIFWSPKTGLLYRINDKNHLYSSVALTSREPSRSDYRDADADKKPMPERLLNIETGYRLKHNNIRLNANVYYMDYHDQLVLTGEINDVGAPIMTNVARSYRAGLEVNGSVLFSKKFEWDANVSLSRNRIRDFTVYIDDWDTYTQESSYLGETPIAFSPEFMGVSRLKFQPNRSMSMEWIAKYVGKQYIDNTGSETRQLDAYLVHNLRVAYDFQIPGFAGASLTLLLNNLLNAEYETNAWIYRYLYTDEVSGNKQEGIIDGYFPQATRNFLFGLQLRI